MQQLTKTYLLPLCFFAVAASSLHGAGNNFVDWGVSKSTELATSAMRSGLADAGGQIGGIDIGQASQLYNKAGGAVGDALGGALGSFMIMPQIPGVAGLKIQCDFPEKNQIGFDICEDIVSGAEDEFIDGINKITGMLGKGLSVGPCRVGLETRKICRTDLLEDTCKLMRQTIKVLADGAGEAVEEVTPEVVLGPGRMVRESVEYLADMGERLLTSDMVDESYDNCFALLPQEKAKNIKVGTAKKTTLSQVWKEHFNAANVLGNLEKSGATDVYDPRLKDWHNCVLAHPDNTAMCDVRNAKLPKDYTAVQTAINEGKMLLSDGQGRSSMETFERISALSANYASQCATAEDPMACEQKIYDNGYEIEMQGQRIKIEPKKEKARRAEEIERASIYAAFATDKATASDTSEFIYLSEDFAQRVNASERTRFRSMANKKLMKESINRHYRQKILDSKIELVELENTLLKVAASQFYPNKAIEEVQAMMTYFANSNGAKQ